MSLPGDFVSSLYLAPYISKKRSVIDLPIERISNIDLDYQKMVFLWGG